MSVNATFISALSKWSDTYVAIHPLMHVFRAISPTEGGASQRGHQLHLTRQFQFVGKDGQRDYLPSPYLRQEN